MNTHGEAFRDRWNALCHRLFNVDTPAATGEFEEIVRRYAMPERHYHTLEHIEKCLRGLDEVRDLDRTGGALELALWFHDVVYDTHKEDNEERSAGTAGAFIHNFGGNLQLIGTVMELIVATKVAHHESSDARRYGLIVDIDLKEGLVADSPEGFDRVCSQIRREYAWVPAPLYCQGRSTILLGMLKRKHIFHHDIFREKYENQARENIEREVKRLRTP